MRKNNILTLIFVVAVSFISFQCSKDDESDFTTRGSLKLHLTDAPTDDSNIQGTFITIADVKLDGKSVDGFTKQTIEISAYQNGNTKLIFNDLVNAKSYNNITVVLDYETDATGNSPGCFVLTNDNKNITCHQIQNYKEKLQFQNLLK